MTTVDISNMALPAMVWVPVITLVAILLWTAIAPRSAWRATRSAETWRYKNAENLELSRAGVAAARLSSVALLALIAAMIPLLLSITGPSEEEHQPEQERQQQLYEECINNPGRTLDQCKQYLPDSETP